MPTAPTHFVQALAATASTRRFGLQPSSSAVVTLPAGLSVRLRRAHDVWDVVEVPPPPPFALRRLDLTFLRRVVPPPPIACLQVRGFSASPIPRARDLVSAAGGNGINNDEPAAAAPGSTKTRVLWVQRAGAKDIAKLVTRASDVGDLKEDIQKKLELTAPLDSITLQLAVKGAGGTDKLVSLDSMDTIDEALTKALGGAVKPADKLRIIVHVDAPAATLAAGVECECQAVHDEHATDVGSAMRGTRRLRAYLLPTYTMPLIIFLPSVAPHLRSLLRTLPTAPET